MLFVDGTSLRTQAGGMEVLVNTSASVVNLNGTLYVFYVGSGRDGIWYTTYDGNEWSEVVSVTQQVPTLNVLEDTSPNALAVGRSLYLFYYGSGGDGIWYATYDGTAWQHNVVSVRQQVPTMNVMPKSSPAAVLFGSRIFLFYNGNGHDGIWYATLTGTAWAGVTSIRRQVSTMNVMDGTSPAAIVYQNKLYVFYVGSGGGIWYTVSSDGNDWNAVVSQVPGSANSRSGTSPAATALESSDGKLYVFWTGPSTQGIWYAAFDGVTWQPSSSMAADMGATQVVTNGTSASVAAFAGVPYVFWIAPADGEILGVWFSAAKVFRLSIDVDTVIDSMRASKDFFVSVDMSDAVAYLRQALGQLSAAEQIELDFTDTNAITLAPEADSATKADAARYAPTPARPNISGAVSASSGRVTRGVGMLFSLMGYGIYRGYNFTVVANVPTVANFTIIFERRPDELPMSAAG